MIGLNEPRRCELINARGTAGEVAQAVWDAVASRFALRAPVAAG